MGGHAGMKLMGELPSEPENQSDGAMHKGGKHVSEGHKMGNRLYKEYVMI